MPAGEWTVLYHGSGKPEPGAFKGRAEFLKIILEDAGVTDWAHSNAGMYGPTGSMDMFRGSAENVSASDDVPFPVVFPPAIHHKPTDGSPEVFVNQVHACMAYMCNVLGYKTADAAEQARADCICLNAQDMIGAGRLSFHPIKGTMSYNDQKEEGDKASAVWAREQLPVWLAHFEKVAKRAAGKPLAGGANLTHADFAVFHILNATVVQFNNEKYDTAWDKTDVPALKAFYAAFCERPNLKAYWASDRCVQFAGDSMM